MKKNKNEFSEEFADKVEKSALETTSFLEGAMKDVGWNEYLRIESARLILQMYTYCIGDIVSDEVIARLGHLTETPSI